LGAARRQLESRFSFFHYPLTQGAFDFSFSIVQITDTRVSGYHSTPLAAALCVPLVQMAMKDEDADAAELWDSVSKKMSGLLMNTKRALEELCSNKSAPWVKKYIDDTTVRIDGPPAEKFNLARLMPAAGVVSQHIADTNFNASDEMIAAAEESDVDLTNWRYAMQKIQSAESVLIVAPDLLHVAQDYLGKRARVITTNELYNHYRDINATHFIITNTSSIDYNFWAGFIHMIWSRNPNDRKPEIQVDVVGCLQDPMYARWIYESQPGSSKMKKLLSDLVTATQTCKNDCIRLPSISRPTPVAPVLSKASMRRLDDRLQEVDRADFGNEERNEFHSDDELF
jgi:hypothetical protein